MSKIDLEEFKEDTCSFPGTGLKLRSIDTFLVREVGLC